MRVNDLDKLGLSGKTMAGLEVSVADVVTDDEFNRPGGKDYRNAAIDRLVGLKVPFTSNCNISFDVMRRFVKVECPYCGSDTEASGGGGSNRVQSMTYVCRKKGCEARVYLSTFGDGISFDPPEKTAK